MPDVMTDSMKIKMDLSKVGQGGYEFSINGEPAAKELWTASVTVSSSEHGNLMGWSAVQVEHHQFGPIDVESVYTKLELDGQTYVGKCSIKNDHNGEFELVFVPDGSEENLLAGKAVKSYKLTMSAMDYGMLTVEFEG